jgi:adenylate cyclase
MVEGGRIYGDSVNVAARLESIAPVGGVAVSKSVRDQVAPKVDFRFEDMGEHALKNIRRPVHAFRIGESTKRAIVSAGVATLTKLLENDPEAVISALKAHRTASDPVILSHGGRTVDAQQDRILYEFPSAVEAVKCASEVQALMAGRNATVPVDRRMQFQLGIHEASDEEAVAVAALIEESASPGGMSLSDAIYRQVVPTLHLNFVDGGSVERGIKVWKVGPPAPAQAKQSDLTGPGVLLVLPFDRMGSNPDQDYLVDGITEDLISAISEYGEFRVVPRGSAFAFRNSGLDTRNVARRLDATYVLTGSARASQTRVRVSVELIEADSDEMLWSERFDRTFEDILDLQDEIAFAITSRLTPTVRDREVRRSLSRADSIESWDLMQRAKWHYYQATKDDFDTAVDLYRQAIAADPNNPQVYPWLCLALITRIWHGWSQDVRGDFEYVHRMASEGIRLDSDNWRAHNALAVYYMFMTRDFDRAIAEAKHGEKFEPGTLGGAYQRAGDYEQSIELTMRDLQINPNRADRYHWTTNLSQSHYMLGNYEAALSWAERSLEINPRYIQAVGFKAASLAQLGRSDEASAEMDRFLDHFSDMTAARYRTRFNFKNSSDIDHYMEGLIKAGMPAGDEVPDERTG